MNAKYQCAACHAVTEIAYTKLAPTTFGCPACSSVSKIENGITSTIAKLTGSFKDVYADLNETVVYNGKTYYIVGISTKQEKGSYVTWNEYILADHNGDLIFLAHGSDFNSYLVEIPLTTEMAEQAKLGGSLKYKTSNYDFDFAQYAQPVAAKGVFFNNILEESYNRTFQNDYYDTQFLSIEKYGDKTEAFFGEYLDKSSFKKLFASQREINYLKSNVSKNIALLFALVSLIMGMLHYALNSNHTDTKTYTGMLLKEPNHHEYVKSGSYTVDKDDQKVTVEFVSETTNANTQLNVALVNEKTNETHLIQGVKHFFNSKNYASSNKVQFCGIDKGTYHLVFASNLSDQTQNNIDIDYKIQIGGTTLTWLYVALALLVVTGFIYHYTLVENADLTKIQKLADFIKYKSKQPLLIAFIALVAYCAGNYMFVSNKNCSNSINTSNLEDATYTGSRTHYVHRIYSSGSHK